MWTNRLTLVQCAHSHVDDEGVVPCSKAFWHQLDHTVNESMSLVLTTSSVLVVLDFNVVFVILRLNPLNKTLNPCGTADRYCLAAVQ